MTVLLNKALAATASTLVLLVLAGCKPAPDPRAESDRGTTTSQRPVVATQDRAAARQDGEGPDARTTGMGAAPASALPGVPGALPPPAGGREPDPEITAGVKARLAADAELRGVRIDVDTRDGVVTLSGSVPTAAVRARAGELAHAVKGVRRVNDQLTLASG